MGFSSNVFIVEALNLESIRIILAPRDPLQRLVLPQTSTDLGFLALVSIDPVFDNEPREIGNINLNFQQIL